MGRQAATVEGIEECCQGLGDPPGITWIHTSRSALRGEAHRAAVPVSFRKCLDELPVVWQFSLPALMSGVL
jgi:hypothetical protein